MSTKQKRFLIGSISLASALIIIAGSFTSSLFFTTNSPIKVTKQNELEDWTYVVPDDFKTINEAVENAKSGDSIFVKKGTYSHGFISRTILIQKNNITLWGEEQNNTIINGRGQKIVVSIDSDNVTFGNFTVKNNGVNGTLLTVYGDDNKIKKNIFSVYDDYEGIEYGIKIFSSLYNNFSENKIFDGEYGIQLFSCEKNTFYNNTVEACNIAFDFNKIVALNYSNRFTEKLYLKPSNYNSFINNNIKDNGAGIVLDDSQGNIFLGNIFSNNRYGLTLSSCTENTIKNNTFINDGLELWGSKIEHYTHIIEGNTVNGKPLYYFYDKKSFDVPSDAGQIIIVNCKQVMIKDVVISNTSTGLLVVFSDVIIVTDSEFYKNRVGIYLYYSNQCVFRRNNFIKNVVHTHFVSQGYFNSKSNKWRSNYWQNIIGTKTKIFKRIPRKITGICHFKNRFGRFRIIPLIIVREYDIRPVREPYNIK